MGRGGKRPKTCCSLGPQTYQLYQGQMVQVSITGSPTLSYIHGLLGNVGQYIVAAYAADVELPKTILKLLQKITYKNDQEQTV